MLKISLVYITYRPGGIDFLVHSLKQQTYNNWELVIVDDCPGRDLTKYLKERGMPLAYCGPSKEKYYKDAPFSVVNAMNTGILHATGDVVVIAQDYQYLPPHGMARWNEVFSAKPGAIVTGCGIEISYLGKFKIGDVSIFDPEFTGWATLQEPEVGRFARTCATSPDGKWIPGRDLIRRTGTNCFKEGFDAFTSPGMEIPHEIFYAGYPVEYLEQVNGLDERMDYGGDLPMRGSAYQIFLNNREFMVDTENVCYYLHHRLWNMGGDPTVWHVLKGKVNKYQWYEIAWNKVSPNNFNLKESHR